jgi:hypothetical protein
MKTIQVKLEDADFKPIEWHPNIKGKISMAYLIYGEQLSMVVGKCEPGAEFVDDPPHEVEEVLYILQGKVEYEDGRVVTGGMATMNLAGQPHRGKFVSDDPDDPNKPVIFVEVAAYPKLLEIRDKFKAVAQRDK